MTISLILAALAEIPKPRARSLSAALQRSAADTDHELYRASYDAARYALGYAMRHPTAGAALEALLDQTEIL